MWRMDMPWKSLNSLTDIYIYIYIYIYIMESNPINTWRKIDNKVIQEGEIYWEAKSTL